MKTIKIREPFWGAGTTFAWKAGGHDQVGVGLNKQDLLSNEELMVEVRGRTYKVNCARAIEFIRKYKSFQDKRGGVRIGIISMSIMEPQDDDERTNADSGS
jgi:hypothetical protein